MTASVVPDFIDSLKPGDNILIELYSYGIIIDAKIIGEEPDDVFGMFFPTLSPKSIKIKYDEKTADILGEDTTYLYYNEYDVPNTGWRAYEIMKNETGRN